jgi:hypothetical protein
VRVILKNEKYIGRWVYGRRIFYKDPLSGRRRARLRPPSEWQTADYPDLQIISKSLWQTDQGRFIEQAERYQSRERNGRLLGRKTGETSAGHALFSGLLQCGVCGGGLTAVSGSRRGGTQRFGCSFHRNKGSQICANDLTVKSSLIEANLLEVIRRKILHPEALTYLVSMVNSRLQDISSSHDRDRETLQIELKQVEEALQNIERAILAGLVGETTGKMLKKYEGRRKDLQAQLSQASQKLTQTLSVDAETICGKIKKLDKLLNTDSTRVNAFFRKHLSPIVCTPEKENGQRFYRARGAARGQELLALFGIETPFAIRGCGGLQLPIALDLKFETDLI